MQGRHCVAFFANNVFSPGIGVGEMDYGSWSLGGWGGLPPKLSVLLGAPQAPPTRSVHLQFLTAGLFS